jgi:hypothetical protein
MKSCRSIKEQAVECNRRIPEFWSAIYTFGSASALVSLVSFEIRLYDPQYE